MTKRCLGSMYQGIIMFIVFYKPGNCFMGEVPFDLGQETWISIGSARVGGNRTQTRPVGTQSPRKTWWGLLLAVRVFLREGRLQEFPTPAMPIETFLPFMSPLVPPSSNPDPLTVRYGVQENRRASTCPHRLGCFQSNPLALEAWEWHTYDQDGYNPKPPNEFSEM